MLAKRRIRSQLCVDSKYIHDTITTLHDRKEYGLKQTVQRMRGSFESKELNVLGCIPAIKNIADALKKRNAKLYRTLNNIRITGFLLTEIEHVHSLDSNTGRWYHWQRFRWHKRLINLQSYPRLNQQL